MGLYGFLALSFGDVDTDKDGLINAEQFDQLLAEVAALPRRYGLAPLDVGDAVSVLSTTKSFLIPWTQRMAQLVVCLAWTSSLSGPTIMWKITLRKSTSALLRRQ